MAIDRPDDDSARPERQVPVGGLGVDVPAARSGTVEPRGREEYYEVLRAADGKPPEVADSQPDRSGWDSVCRALLGDLRRSDTGSGPHTETMVVHLLK